MCLRMRFSCTLIASRALRAEICELGGRSGCPRPQGAKILKCNQPTFEVVRIGFLCNYPLAKGPNELPEASKWDNMRNAVQNTAIGGQGGLLKSNHIRCQLAPENSLARLFQDDGDIARAAEVQKSEVQREGS